jgi:iron complex transport system substrate-binding protein
MTRWIFVIALCAAALASAADHVRFVSLAPNLTALAFEAGAGEHLVGTVEFSDHPEAARAIPRVGNAYQVDFERVVAADPDFVLAWESGTPTRTLEQLERLGLDVVVIPTYRLDDIAVAIRRIGELAGTESVAELAATKFERSIDAFVAPAEMRPLRVFIEVDDQPLYTVNGEHLISELVARCGGRNIFADLKQIAPVVGLESVIAAEPEVILSTDDTVENPLAAWATWTEIPAVRARAIYKVPADDVAQATTRVTQGLKTICSSLRDARNRLAKLRL